MNRQEELFRIISQAYEMSGRPTATELVELRTELFQNPEMPPKNISLWPLFTIIRQMIQDRMPEGCLSDEFFRDLERDSNNNRVGQINDYLANEHRVCPYAVLSSKNGDIHYEPVPDLADETETIKQIKDAIARFLESGKKVLIFHFNNDFCNHAEAKDTSLKFYELFKTASLQIAFGENYSPENVRRYENLLDIIVNNNSQIVFYNINSYQDLRNGLFFSFFVNNLYPKVHARYSPVPAMVVTFNSDLQHIITTKPGVIQKINVNTLITHFAAALGKSFDEVRSVIDDETTEIPPAIANCKPTDFIGLYIDPR
jgi:hypothetical protein